MLFNTLNFPNQTKTPRYDAIWFVMLTWEWFCWCRQSQLGMKTARKVSGFRTWFRKQKVLVGIFLETFFSKTETNMIRQLSIENRNPLETFRKWIQFFSRDWKRSISHIQLISFCFLYSKCLNLYYVLRCLIK